MTRMSAAAVAFAALLGWPGAAPGQDPLSRYPQNYRVLFENDQVRVLDFRLARGDREDAHAHPAHVAVFLNEFRIRFTLPDGTVVLRDARPFQVSWSDPTTHASQNIGESDAHGILIELKTPPAGAR